MFANHMIFLLSDLFSSKNLLLLILSYEKFTHCFYVFILSSQIMQSFFFILIQFCISNLSLAFIKIYPYFFHAFFVTHQSYFSNFIDMTDFRIQFFLAFRYTFSSFQSNDRFLMINLTIW